MPRTKKATSRRSKKEVKDEIREMRETLLLSYQSLKKKLESDHTLRDEELRFIKNFPSIMKMIEYQEQQIEEVGVEVLPEGKVKEFIDRLWRHTELFREATGNDKAVLDEETYNRIIEKMGYVRCPECNELHKAEEKDCIYLQFFKKIKKARKKKN